MAGLTSKGLLPSFLGSPNRRISQGMDQLKSMKAAHRRQAIGISGEVGGIGSSRWAISLKGQGDNFQTHSECHFQRQSSYGSFSNTKTKSGGHFQTQAHFLTAGTAFSRRSQGFLSHENYVITSQPCRITTGGDWGLGTGLGFGACFGSGSGGVIFKHTGVICKHRHTFGRQGQQFHDVPNVFICKGIL